MNMYFFTQRSSDQAPRYTAAFVIAFVWALSGCSTANEYDIVPGKDRPNTGSNEAGDKEDAAISDGANSTVNDSSTASDATVADALVLDDTKPPSEIVAYAHDKNSLYKIDPTNMKYTVTKVGDFDCIGTQQSQAHSMTDLAVDSSGKLYGVSSSALFLDMKIENTTIKCQHSKVKIQYPSDMTSNQARFYGLTIAPPSQNLGSEETLIGANTLGELYVINKTTGQLTLAGKFGSVPSDDSLGHFYDSKHVGKNWALSGDLVFLENKGNPIGFATVRDCEDPSKAPATCNTVDTLIEIDPNRLRPSSNETVPTVTKSVRGQILPGGCDEAACGFGSMYGIAAYNEHILGFVYKRKQPNPTGMLITIDNGNARATYISTPLTSDGFAGAGITTLAPIKPPPPK